ncbi:MAG: hypothetical protein ACYCZY_05500 [Lacisediminihabitans sp.]
MDPALSATVRQDAGVVPTPLPPALDSQPFSVASALSAGVSRKRLRGNDLHAPFHAIRTQGSAPNTIEALARAYLPRMSDGQFFSHGTAARLYGMPLPLELQRERHLHVAVVEPAHPPQARGVIGHRIRIDRARIQLSKGLLLASPVDVWCQLGAILELDELVMAGDFLVRRKKPMSTLDQLEAALVLVSGQRGARRLREAMALVRSGTDSPMETKLRLLLIRGGLPEPLIGLTVKDADGFFVATPDLSYPRERVALEYEGDGHRTNQQTFRDDIERRELLEDAGWRVIRVMADHVLKRPAWLVRRVARILAERAG